MIAETLMHAGRNDPCPCGSGKKIKKCCGEKRQQEAQSAAFTLAEYHHHRIDQAKQAYNAGDHARAHAFCMEILKQNPHYPEALHLYGWLVMLNGGYQDAVLLFERAIAGNPKEARYYDSLARAYGYMNKLNEAIGAATKATQLSPNYATLHFTLGKLYTMGGKTHEASECYKRVLALEPNDPAVYYSLYESLYREGAYHEAEALKRMVQTRSDIINLHAFELTFLLLMPPIMESVEAIEMVRNRIETDIRSLLSVTLPATAAENITMEPPFLLAFHHQSDKQLLQQLAALYLHAMPLLSYTAPHCLGLQERKEKQPVRIGVLSRYLYTHSVGKCFSKLFAAMCDDQELEIILFTNDGTKDALLEMLSAKVKSHIVLPVSLVAAREVIAAEQLDILIYTDIGMDVNTSLLAYARLAPYQCCLAGHPNTTGIPTIDYFISTHTMEPPGAEAHYSEKLALINNVTVFIDKPPIPPLHRTRQELGVPEDVTLYVCPLKLQKIHPDFDRALEAILSRDPEGIVVMFKDNMHENMATLIQKRFAKTLAPFKDRILFVPFLSEDAFLDLLRLADVLLDSFYFSAGTTAYLACAAGVPMVTLEGDFLRGRVTSHCYHLMGLNGLTAKTPDEYVDIALALAKDKALYNRYQQHMLTHNHVLFGDTGAAKEIANFCKNLVVGKR